MSEYEIYSIRLSTNAERRSPQNFLNGDSHDDAMPMDFFVWAVTNSERTVLVDTGFNPEMARRRGREIWRPVDQGLAQIGIDCSTVPDVVVTHMHWDHVGNYEMFPNARYHVQDREMHYCTGRCMCHPMMKFPYEPADINQMVGKIFDGRVTFHDGSVEPWPDISLHWVGGHSAGLQVVRVRTRRGWVVLASDASHYYANIGDQRPYPIVHNLEDMFEAYRTVNSLASSPMHIIPGHDPKQLLYYPAARDGLEGTVRVDLDPIQAH